MSGIYLVDLVKFELNGGRDNMSQTETLQIEAEIGAKMHEASTTTVPELSSLCLSEAFERFRQASTRLEAKYQELLVETDVLRHELKEKEAEVKRGERLSLLGQMAAAIAHEVRNPLGAIQLYASLLKDELPLGSKGLSFAEGIEKNVTRVDTLVRNILHFSTQKALRAAPLNMGALLADVVECLYLPADQRHKIVQHVAGNPFILGCETSLRQVLTNLITNGLQAVRAEGTVVVNIRDDGPQMLVIEVCDSGPGIPLQVLDSLFDPFVTTKQAGTGLGLAIVRQFVELHRGKVTASNLPHGGACFTVRLPRG